MSKFKLVLTAAAVFAIVGTAIAIKPTLGTQRICYQASVNGMCTLGTQCIATNPVPAVANSGNTHCYRFVNPTVTNCGGLTCTNLGKVTFE